MPPKVEVEGKSKVKKKTQTKTNALGKKRKKLSKVVCVNEMAYLRK